MQDLCADQFSTACSGGGAVYTVCVCALPSSKGRPIIQLPPLPPPVPPPYTILYKPIAGAYTVFAFLLHEYVCLLFTAFVH